MDRVVFVMASGAKQILQAQARNSHNLANINTVGFQADLTNFAAQMVNGPGHESRTYAVAQEAGASFEKGTIQSTGRQLDVAVAGNGLLSVQAPDGSEAYTRAGNLHVNINGQLLTGAGYPVLGDNGPILIPEYQNLEIGVDGTISVQPIGQQASTLAEVGRIKLVSTDANELVKGRDGLLRARGGNSLEPAADVELISGALESSNVSGVEAMVNMIDLARSFELAVQIMQTAKEMDEGTTKLMEIG